MIAYYEISPGMRAYLGTFMTIRALGYPATSIFLLVESGMWNARLDHLGNQFTIALGFWNVSPKGVFDEYAVILKATAKQEGGVQISETDLTRMVNECEARRNFPQLIAALMRKGFRVPLPQEN